MNSSHTCCLPITSTRLALVLACVAINLLNAGEPPPLSLAISLSSSGNPADAALEFRRQAMDASDHAGRAALFWSAAREYLRAGDQALADTMLDAAENADPALLPPTLLLRGETAAATHDWPVSAFYFQGLASSATDTNMARFATRRLAVAELYRRNPEAARTALAGLTTDEAAPLAALGQYKRGHDKRPWMGGLLGLIPGLGYAYSGEFANAGRSLILNSLFIFGMVNTAERENWGAFAAISFFEITWYSGSIYGGIDAAHRYNRDRLDTCADGIMDRAVFEPDYRTLPVLTLQFHF